MSVDGNISQIVLPNGTTYDIEDATARGMDLVATYTAATLDLALNLESLASSDDEEF